MIYRLYFADMLGKQKAPNAAMTFDEPMGKSFLFDPANSDYVAFKIQVADGTPLEDPEGNVMTQEQVDEFLRTIP